MKVFHIDEFKCMLCSNWFCPPFTLPYRLKCTHSICTNCLEKSIENHSNQIICPEDLQKNKISEITINQSTKKALQRLLKQHKNLTQTNHLQCIKSLSMTFDELLDSKQIQLKNLSTLIDQIFQNQIKRLRQIYGKIKIEINRPFRIVNDWKEVVRNYLKKIKTQGQSSAKGTVSEFNHYIQEGRKIKLDLNEYLKHDFKELIDVLLMQPQHCFTHNFSIFDQIQNKQNSNRRNFNTAKFQTLGKKLRTIQKSPPIHNERQIFLQDLTNNFDQSSIREGQKTFQIGHQNSNKLSLFEQLIQQTPTNKNNKWSSNLHMNSNSNQNPLKQMIFSSSQNIYDDNSITNTDGQSLKNIRKNQQQKNQQKKSKLETINCSTLQSGKKDYSVVLNEKIQKNKQKNTKQMVRKPKFIGKSLQYSPDGPNYGQLQAYTVQDTYYDELNPFQNNSQTQLKSYDQYYSYADNTKNTDHHIQIQKTHQIQQQTQNQMQYEDEELLLEERSHENMVQKQNIRRRNDWQLSHLNFLKQWKIQKGLKTQQMQIIQKQGGYNCEKEKNKYARRIQELRVKEVMKETTISDNFISIVGQNLSECNLVLLLSQIDWKHRRIQIVKLIKTGLSDVQLNQLLNFLVKSQVHTLMLSYNNLTQLSLDALLHFVQINSTLRNIYLPKNNISLLKGNARPKINLLKQKGINLYI